MPFSFRTTMGKRCKSDTKCHNHKCSQPTSMGGVAYTTYRVLNSVKVSSLNRWLSRKTEWCREKAKVLVIAAAYQSVFLAVLGIHRLEMELHCAKVAWTALGSGLLQQRRATTHACRASNQGFSYSKEEGLAPGLVSHTAEFPTPPANVEAPFNYGNLEKAVNKAASSNISGRYENVALHEEQKSTLNSPCTCWLKKQRKMQMCSSRSVSLFMSQCTHWNVAIVLVQNREKIEMQDWFQCHGSRNVSSFNPFAEERAPASSKTIHEELSYLGTQWLTCPPRNFRMNYLFTRKQEQRLPHPRALFNQGVPAGKGADVDKRKIPGHCCSLSVSAWFPKSGLREVLKAQISSFQNLILSKIIGFMSREDVAKSHFSSFSEHIMPEYEEASIRVGAFSHPPLLQNSSLWKLVLKDCSRLGSVATKESCHPRLQSFKSRIVQF
ncbi:hypothetical protein CK203_051051 [Vitis vinifera]|uniref:Uncharacterized protein n=1 Tax=Vitis vinifera TaxID=29760 RepID=A0A438GPX3_VITVI|nr:hypothetical protein CK203_051051 [Vitis vinifera]